MIIFFKHKQIGSSDSMCSGSLPVSCGFIAVCLTKRHQAKKTKKQCPPASQTPSDAACDTWFFAELHKDIGLT